MNKDNIPKIGGKVTSLNLYLDIDTTIELLDKIIKKCYRNAKTRTCIYKGMEFYSYGKYTNRSPVLSFYTLNFQVTYKDTTTFGQFQETLIQISKYLKVYIQDEYNTEDILILSIERNLDDIYDIREYIK